MINILNKYNYAQNISAQDKAALSINQITQALTQLKEVKEEMKKNVCINGKIPQESLIDESIERLEYVLSIFKNEILIALNSNEFINSLNIKGKIAAEGKTSIM